MNDSENVKGELIVLERDCRSLLETNALDTITSVRDEAERIRLCARNAAAGLEIQNKAAVIRLRAERRAGELFRELHLRGGNRRSKAHDELLNLEKIGIERNQSRRWQMVASMPLELFEGYFSECFRLQQEITFSGLMRHRNRRVREPEVQGMETDDSSINIAATMLKSLVANGQTYPCICIYPPWPKRRRFRVERVDRQFRKRFLNQLRRLPIAELATSNCHAHLCVTSERLRDGIRLLESWEFTYRDVLVCGRSEWDYGSYWHVAQDFVLLGTKGHKEFDKNDSSSLVDANGHVVNGLPLLVRPLIEKVNQGPYLEVFGPRGKSRPRWTIVGD